MIFFVNLLLVCLLRIMVKALPMSRRKQDILFLSLCTIQFTLIAGTRNIDFDSDTPNYYRVYIITNQYASPFQTEGIGRIEILYICLCWLCGHTGLGFVGVNLIMAFLTMLFLSKALYALSDDVFVSIFFFITSFWFNQMMGQYRQILALAIFLYALSLWIKHKSIKPLIWIAVASGFHTSVFCTLPLFLITNVKLTKRVVRLFVLGTVLLIISLRGILFLISHTKYSTYIGSFYDVEGKTSTILNLAVRAVMLLLAALFYKRIKTDDQNYDIFYYMIIMVTSLQILTVFSALFGRITTYFYSGYLIIIPAIMRRGIKGIRNRYLLNAGVYVVLCLEYYLYYGAKYSVIPTHYVSYLFR